jgi:hypothetical protein
MQSPPRRVLVPLLLVPGVALPLVVARPQLATAGLQSGRAFAVTVGVGVAGLLTLALLWRRSRVGALWAADLVVLALMAAVVWPVLRERTVVEAFPPVAAAPVVTSNAGSTPTPSPAAAPRRTPRRPAPAVPVMTTAPRSTPSVVATRLLAGSLHGIGHHAKGTVALYDVGGTTRLRFEGVAIEGTPTPSVHLVEAGKRSPKGGTRLGGLKGEKGSFSYAAPAGFDPSAGWSVLVWCDRYAVPIAAADLR